MPSLFHYSELYGFLAKSWRNMTVSQGDRWNCWVRQLTSTRSQIVARMEKTLGGVDSPRLSSPWSGGMGIGTERATRMATVLRSWKARSMGVI